MARRMAELGFRQEQWEHRFDPHIVPINRFVDELNELGRGKAPYVAPMYGGVAARLLSVLRDPGPKTQSENEGSGFLCMENNDPTAERICGLFHESCIDAREIVPWNAYPWYINRNPRAAELDAGVEPLKRILDLLPELRVVMLHGGIAKKGWRRLIRKFPDVAATRRLLVLETYHTSPRAFIHRDPNVRDARRKDLREAFHTAAQHLGV